MNFDKFLAKLFSKKGLICILIAPILALLLSSCRFTEEDCWYCYCFGCLSPDTCNACMTECLDCVDESCFNCFWFCTGWVDCDSCRSAENNENLRESCIGRGTVSIFDCINDCCEDCE